MSAVLAVLLAILAVGSGVLVFVVDSMARATYLLAVSFIAVGLELLLLDLTYLGIITILMMVMEMAIMAVFMVMYMMNPAGLMPMSMLHNKTGALALSIGAFVVLAGGALLVSWPERTGTPPSADLTKVLGEAVMGPKMLVMMTISAVLFATMVSALVLATAHSRYSRDTEVSLTDGGSR